MQRVSGSMNSSFVIPTSQKFQNFNYLLHVEGQCKISELEPLRIRYCKFVPILIISILTIIPGIILLNFKKSRKYLLYSRCDFGQADHLFVQAEDGNQDLVPIQIYQPANYRLFTFKQLTYRLEGKQYYPMVMDYRFQLTNSNLQSIINSGLSNSQVKQNEELYGRNIHTIEIQNYFSYMASVIFQPLFILQYVVILSLIAQGVPVFGIILFVASMATTSGNYVALYFSKLKIRQMAERKIIVNVIRNNIEEQIQSSQLVPGDVVTFKGRSDVPCDCIILEGDAFVNQSSLTGQNIPIKKVQFNKNMRNNIENHQFWLYDGTKIVQTKYCKAVVIFTGFSSKKGRLLRKILNRIPSQPDFFRRIFLFLLESFLIAMCLYGATMPIRLNANIDRPIIALRALDYLMSSVPPAFPVYFTIAYSWSLYRLKKKGIFSTMPQKTVESNRLKTACFDKTGTLTQNNLQFNAFYTVSKKEISTANLAQNTPQNNFAKTMFGTCHSVREIDGENQGDQVDLRLWELSKFKDLGNCQFVNQNGQKFTVLVLNQFQSKFQSMSVLVRQEKTGNHYAIVKGAPQKIHSYSITKCQSFKKFISQMSFKGLRTIAFGWKKIGDQQVKRYLSKHRDQFLQQIQLSSVVVFQNFLKAETASTIKKLHQANIETKMITGDNIFIAVQIAYQAGILPAKSEVLLIEGKKFDIHNGNKRYLGLQVSKRFGKIQKTQRHYQMQDIVNTKKYIAVDNYFISDPDFSINNQMVVFARILPDKKAKIVELIKKSFEFEHDNVSCCEKIFFQARGKVAMVGDGANDLMAIKQADVGVGINGTDAAYSAAFTISTLDQLIYIIKQGKATTLNIIQCLKFIIIANYINLIVEIVLATQSTFISQRQGLYMNFLVITLVPILLALSQPSEQLDANRVKDNFICWQNQLVVWFTLIIIAGGFVGSYYFVTSSSNYIPNPSPKWQVGIGYNYNCQLVTLIYLAEGLALTSLGWVIFQSKPFKKMILNNIVLTVILTLNFVAYTAYFFIINVSEIGFLNLLPIALSDSGIEYSIMITTILVAFLFNLFMHKVTYKTTPNLQIAKKQSEESDIEV